jgi:hypothetical protein
MAITLTSRVLWQLTGFDLGDGNQETVNGELFTGIGFFAKPPSSGSPEAIAVSVGGAKTMVILGVRDQKTLAAIAGAINQDEAMVFGSQALVYVKNDGTVEIRTPSGSAQALALKSDVSSLVTTFNAHVHPVPGVTVGGGATTSSVTGTLATAPTGTAVLKGG